MRCQTLATDAHGHKSHRDSFCRRGEEEEEAWTQQGRSYERWLCRLGDALLERCRDPQLRALQKVARRRPAMMELAMPRIFASLALEGSSDGCDLSESLAAQVCSAHASWDICTVASDTAGVGSAGLHVDRSEP